MIDYPLITIGLVVLNRAWIIEKVITSILGQSYPRDKIYLLVVDGASKDDTVHIVEGCIKGSSLFGYKIIVRECNIPEGRNLCIENMMGDYLFFWDSDVIIKRKLLEKMFQISINNDIDVLSCDSKSVYLKNVSEINKIIDEYYKEKVSYDDILFDYMIHVGMGSTLIKRKVFEKIKFDPDLTIAEDSDFALKTIRNNFKIALIKNILVLDIDILSMDYSDIHIDMSIRDGLKGLRKKVKSRMLINEYEWNIKRGINYFYDNKRLIFYLGYLPITLISLYGLIKNNVLSILFILYFLSHSIYQIRKRNLSLGLKSSIRSILVGIPYATLVIYYILKYSIFGTES
jgi:glycosyltransferase involved in cell wall biosynthesis